MVRREHASAFLGLALLALGLPPVAGAQTSSSSSAANNGYVEAVAQSAFGNVTSQSYGGEFGVTVWQPLQVFVEAGRIRDVATSSVGAAAQKIAMGLANLQPAAVTYSVKQPVTIFGVGVRYPIEVQNSRIVPYVLGGGGAAKVTTDVRFRLGGVDATPSSLSQFVTFGSDLSGNVTKPMLTLGGGVMWTVWNPLVLDLQYRYGRVFTENQGINVNRAGLGVGIRF